MFAPAPRRRSMRSVEDLIAEMRALRNTRPARKLGSLQRPVRKAW